MADWYKRDPRAALEGMFELSLEERGAYNTVLDLIYDRNDKLPDDDRYIAGCCRCDLRVWRRIKKVLIEREKLAIEDGYIRNYRASYVVRERLAKSVATRNAALIKHGKSSDVLPKNNDLADANADADALLRTRVLDLDSERKKDISDSSSPHPPAGERKPDRFPVFDRLPKFKNGRIYPDEFEAFWKVYPRRATDTKKPAYAAWRKPACNGVGPIALQGSAESYRKFIDNTEGEPKLVQSWINAEGWTATYELPERHCREGLGRVQPAQPQPGGRDPRPGSFVAASREVLALRSRQS